MSRSLFILCALLGLAALAGADPPGDDTRPSRAVAQLTGLNAPVSARSPEDAARQELQRHRAALGLARIDLSAHSLAPLSVKSSRGGTHVRMQQIVDGIPVWRATATVHLDPAATAVRSIQSALRPLPADPPASGDAAFALSAEEAVDVAAAAVGAPVRALPPHAQKAWVIASLSDDKQRDTDESDRPSLEPAWRVDLVTADLRGDWEVMVHARSGEILHQRNRMLFENGQGQAFNPDPITTSGASYGDFGYIDNNDADSPQLNAERVAVTLPDLTFRDGFWWLEGPHVVILDFDQPSNEKTHATSLTGFSFPRSHDSFEDVSAYHFIDSYQRHVQELGFSDLQNGPLPVDPRAHGMDGSNYSPSSNWILCGTGGVDDAEDADVLWHEYTHALHYEAAGGISGWDVLSAAEGVCDYMAASLSARRDEFNATRVFNWDGWNEFWPGRSIEHDLVYPDHWYVNRYIGGTILANSFWLIRQEIGPDDADALLLEFLYHLTPDQTVLQIVQSLLAAEDALFGGQYRAQVEAGLDAKGFIVPWGTVEVTVTDRVTGEPVAGATVTVQSDPPSGQWMTNAEGQVTTGPIPTGSWSVTAEADGYGTTFMIGSTVTEGDTLTLATEIIPYLHELDAENASLHAYIGGAADTTVTVTPLGDNLRFATRVRPVDGPPEPTPFEPHPPIPLQLPPSADPQGFTFLDGRFYVIDHGTTPTSIRVLNTDGELVRSFLMPAGLEGPLFSLTHDDSTLFSVDTDDYLVQMDTLGGLISRVPLEDGANGWSISWDPGLDAFWVGWNEFRPVDRQGTLLDGPYFADAIDPGSPIAVDPGAPDFKSLHLFSSAAGMPRVQRVDPLDDTYELVTLAGDGPLNRHGADIFTGLQPGLDYQYYANLGLSGTGWFVYLYRLRWTAPWLTVRPAWGFASPAQEVELTLSANGSSVDVGDYAAELIVEGTEYPDPQGWGVPEIMEVTFEVSAVDVPEGPGGEIGGGDKGDVLPERFAVSAPHPNPCNAMTALTVSLPEPGMVTLVAYDLLGRELVRRQWTATAGRHTVSWRPPAGAASGVYLLRVATEGAAPITRKVVVVK